MFVLVERVLSPVLTWPFQNIGTILNFDRCDHSLLLNTAIDIPVSMLV